METKVLNEQSSHSLVQDMCFCLEKVVEQRRFNPIDDTVDRTVFVECHRGSLNNQMNSYVVGPPDIAGSQDVSSSMYRPG